MIIKRENRKHREGQTAIEYLLLLGVVVSVCLVAMYTYFPRINVAMNTYYETVAEGAMGNPPDNTFLTTIGN